jgi:hypothetical protein
LCAREEPGGGLGFLGKAKTESSQTASTHNKEQFLAGSEAASFQGAQQQYNSGSMSKNKGINK